MKKSCKQFYSKDPEGQVEFRACSYFGEDGHFNIDCVVTIPNDPPVTWCSNNSFTTSVTSEGRPIIEKMFFSMLHFPTMTLIGSVHSVSSDQYE